jgi:hypothetical protein
VIRGTKKKNRTNHSIVVLCQPDVKAIRRLAACSIDNRKLVKKPRTFVKLPCVKPYLLVLGKLSGGLRKCPLKSGGRRVFLHELCPLKGVLSKGNCASSHKRSVFVVEFKPPVSGTERERLLHTRTI